MKSEESDIDTRIRALLGETPGFTVPQGYFDELESSISLQLSQGFSEHDLIFISSENCFNVPSGYFENLHTSIIQKVNEELPLTGLQLPEAVGLGVPNLYFEESRNSILKKTIYAKPPVTLPLKRVRLAAWYRYASVAAMFIMSVSLAYWVGKDNGEINNRQTPSSDLISWTELNDKEILESLKTEDIGEDIGEDIYALALVNDAELLNQARKEAAVPEKDSSHKVNKKEMEQFLIENIDEIEEI